jgi:hypothetical protein
MIFDGRVWLSIGRWARKHGLSTDTVRGSLTTGGRVLGPIVTMDVHTGMQIRRVRGADVLIRTVNKRQWLYLPVASVPGTEPADVEAEGDALDAPSAVGGVLDALRALV